MLITGGGVWGERLLEQIRHHAGPIIFVGESRWGAPYLIRQLDSKEQPLVWLGLNSRDEGDEVAQGNKLVEALRRTLKVDLLGYGLPYSYALSVLETYLDLLGPFTFVLSGADYNPDLARRLFDLGGTNFYVAAFTKPPEATAFPEALVIDPFTLKLTLEEAQALAGETFTDADLQQLLLQTGGAYEAFTLAARKRLGFSPPLRPTPEGLRFPASEKVKVDAEALLDVLCNRERWFDALELAVDALPHRISEVLAEAGHRFHEQGMHRRLWKILENVSPGARDEMVLFWQLSSATRLGKTDQMRRPVEAYLQTHPEASELRALFAGTLAPARHYVAEARAAVEVHRSSFTLYQYGRALALEDPLAGEAVLRDAVDLAEQTGRAYEVIRNSWALAARLLALGRYREGVFWSRWAVEKYEASQRSGDVQLWLLSVNEWAFGRILIGEVEGLEGLLLELETHLDRVSPALTRLFRSTLGDYYLACGSPNCAHAYYLKNWQQATRSQLGNDACSLVRVLLELGRQEEALHVAEQAFYLTRGDDQLSAWSAQLAYGMALSFSQTQEALGCLSEVWERMQSPLTAVPLARATLYLARAQLALGNVQEATRVLAGGRIGLEALGESGLALLAGPKGAFHEVFAQLRGRQSALEVTFLGTPTVRFNGQPLDLPLRHLEVLCLLILEPEGLAGGEFVLQLYGESGQSSNLKATLSKLRRLLPIAAQPYRLLVPFQADFVEVEQCLKSGQVRLAIQLYRGSLLPRSEAPGIVEHREVLEESIRQAALESRDEEALIALAEVFRDDLELWERALQVLSSNDPRHSFVQSKTHTLRRAWAI